MVFGGSSHFPSVQEGITLTAKSSFVRGDTNADGQRNIADVVFLLENLFGRTDVPLPCHAACDTNDDNSIDIADGITLLTHLFRGGGPLPEPATECGYDPTPPAVPLSCLTFEPCR